MVQGVTGVTGITQGTNQPQACTNRKRLRPRIHCRKLRTPRWDCPANSRVSKEANSKSNECRIQTRVPLVQSSGSEPAALSVALGVSNYFDHIVVY